MKPADEAYAAAQRVLERAGDLFMQEAATGAEAVSHLDEDKQRAQREGYLKRIEELRAGAPTAGALAEAARTILAYERPDGPSATYVSQLAPDHPVAANARHAWLERIIAAAEARKEK